MAAFKSTQTPWAFLLLSHLLVDLIKVMEKKYILIRII